MPSPVRRMITILTGCFVLWAGLAQAAPAPRGIVSINRPVVKLGDLFTDAGARSADVLGLAPAPGQRIDIESAQLAAIARQYGVHWSPSSAGSGTVVIERPGTPVSAASIKTALRSPLLGAGAPDHLVVQLGTNQLPMIPLGTQPKILVNGIRYDKVNGQFRAALLISANGMKPRTFEVPGIAAPAERVVVARHSLPPGQIVGINDIKLAWVPRSSLSQGTLTKSSDALGMQITRRVAAGTPLSSQAVSRRLLVSRGATVSLSVEMPGLEVTAQGIALEAGAKGTVIPVMNPSSHEVVQAVIDGHDHAHILPGSTPSKSGSEVPYYSRMGR